MCGLVGVCTHQLQRARNATENGLAALIHRGPDDEGTFFHNGRMSLGLGLRRLAIQDLSVSGRQPMSTEDGRYVISFNGEITNFLPSLTIKVVKGNSGIIPKASGSL